MFFVVDKPRFQRIIAIVREDRTPNIQAGNIPYLRIEAFNDKLTVSSKEASATFPATVYEQGVLFIRTTKFRQVLKATLTKERFLTFQFTVEGLRFCDVLFPFDTENMIYFPDPSKSPENWPFSSPALEPIFKENKNTQKQLTMLGLKNEHSQDAVICLKYTVTDDEWPIIKAAKLMLHKMLRSSEINQKEVLNICKILCVFNRLPETSENLDVEVTLFGTFLEDERYHEWEYARWWTVGILGKEIWIESRSGYVTSKMKDGAYSWSTIRMAPGWETVEYSECMAPPHSSLIDVEVYLEDYPEEMEGLDWSLNEYEFKIEGAPEEND